MLLDLPPPTRQAQHTLALGHRICSRFASLCTSICLVLILIQLAQQQQQQPQQQPSGASNSVPLDLSILRDNPQIQQLRDLVHQNPALLQPLIQQIASSNPALAQLFAQDPGALFQLLGDSEQEDVESVSQGTVLSVTEEERAAIERVWDLPPKSFNVSQLTKCSLKR